MKSIYFSILILFLQCASPEQAAYRTIARDLSNSNANKTVAVLPFETNSKDSEAQLIAEKLTHELVSAGNYQVIERNKIDRIVKEQSLSQKGIISQDNSIKIGKLVSADGVLVGSVIQEHPYTTLIARIVDTETGKIWSSSKVSYIATNVSNSTPNSSSSNSSTDNNLKPIISSEKGKGKVKDLQLIRNGNFGKFLGLLTNVGSSRLSGSKLYINLKDKNKNFLDTVLCFTDKPVEPSEEVPFSCVLANFPSEYGSHEIFFEPDTGFYTNYTPFKIVSEKFKEETSGLEGFSLTGILKNDTATTISYPKVILSLYDQNNKFIGSAIGFANQKKLAPEETSSFKVNAYAYSLAGKAKSYKVQTHALASSTVQ